MKIEACFRNQRILGKGIFFLVFYFCLVISGHSELIIEDKPYENIALYARKMGYQVKWLKLGEEMELVGPQNTAILKGDHRDFEFNGTKIWFGDATRVKANKLYISKKDYINTLRPLLLPQVGGIPKTKKIVIDPGHGDKDEGTVNKKYNLKEKDLALDVAIRVRNLLRKNGFSVDLTRTKDIGIEKGERAFMANRMGADMFVSIHFNAAGNETASGIETFALSIPGQPSTAGYKLESGDDEVFPGNKHNSWNALLGYSLQSALHGDLGARDRGVRRARFKVLKWLECPGALIECGFLSNEEESFKLSHPEYRQKLAASICKGIVKYQRVVEGLR